MKINAIVLGATGMVGEGVLHECLGHPDIESVLVINRRPCGVENPKLKEIIHQDFSNFSPIAESLRGYQACFFCMGISSIGKKEADYRKITYDLTMHIASILAEKNSDFTFCYVSGIGTDSTEQGRSMWARIKGKTENDLLRMPFQGAYMFRPGYIQPGKGMKNTYKIYKILSPLFPVLKFLFPKYVNTLEEIGLAMIHAALAGSEKKVLEPPDIRQLAKAD
jgi:uncharacterized protein YbjT (DUF2867 family)